MELNTIRNQNFHWQFITLKNIIHFLSYTSLILNDICWNKYHPLLCWKVMTVHYWTITMKDVLIISDVPSHVKKVTNCLEYIILSGLKIVGIETKLNDL